MIESMVSAGSNWSRTYRYAAPTFVDATSIDEVQALVARSSKVRALGTRHSFNAIADTSGVLVSVTSIDPDIRIDAAARTVTVGAGTRYGVLATALESAGWALHNMGSLPHISVGGAIATGTHGSGNGSGILGTAVSALEIVSADGSLVSVRRGDAGFDGSVVSLGCLGIVVRVTLDIQPSYLMRQDVYRSLRWSSLVENLDEITSTGYSVSVFTDWSEHGNTVWIKSRLDGMSPLDDTVFGAVRDGLAGITGAREPGDNLTEQGGVPGPWLYRLPHFRLDSVPSSGDEIQTEFLVPRSSGVAAIEAVRALQPAIAPHLLISELRTVAADEFWLSPAYARDSLCIHFTWKAEPEAVAELVRTLARVLAPFDARPHWGKVHDIDSTPYAHLYPRLADARELFERADPRGVFRNAFIDSTLFA
jgi:xylitol oxidase